MACLTLLLNSNTCKPPLMEEFYTIVVKNNSPDTVCAYFADGGVNGIQYPDTILPTVRPPLISIYPAKSFNFDSRRPWEDIINGLNADALSVYIISWKTYQDSLWESIRSNNLVLKRYDLSVSDLKATNWRVNYQ